MQSCGQISICNLCKHNDINVKVIYTVFSQTNVSKDTAAIVEMKGENKSWSIEY